MTIAVKHVCHRVIVFILTTRSCSRFDNLDAIDVLSWAFVSRHHVDDVKEIEEPLANLLASHFRV